MKSLLATLMMLLMLTPGLACAKTMCANLDALADGATDTPCQGEMATADVERGLMFADDCANTDLASADPVPTLNVPADKVQTGFATWSAEQIRCLPSDDAGWIRGPPEAKVAHFSYPSVFLSTQRIRL